MTDTFKPVMLISFYLGVQIRLSHLGLLKVYDAKLSFKLREMEQETSFENGRRSVLDGFQQLLVILLGWEWVGGEHGA